MRVRQLLVFLICALPASAFARDTTASKLKALSLPKTEAACVLRGGEWIFAGPQNITKYCFLQTSDGGKACKSSNQCQSECVEAPDGNRCASTFSGCFEPTGRGTVTQCVN